MQEPDRKPLTLRLGRDPVWDELPASWREFIRYCGDLRHGEIEKLCIQDGLPVLAEVITKKIKFTRDR